MVGRPRTVTLTVTNGLSSGIGRKRTLAWLERRGGSLDNYAFPSRVDRLDHLSTRQYSRLVEEWVSGIGLRKEDY